MIAALYSSCADGTKAFCINGVNFGWQSIVKVYESDLYRAQHCISRRVPGLKYAHMVRDSWTRVSVLPAKIMQVCQCKRLPCLMIIMIIHYSSNRTCFQLSGRFRKSPTLNLMLQLQSI